MEGYILQYVTKPAKCTYWVNYYFSIAFLCDYGTYMQLGKLNVLKSGAIVRVTKKTSLHTMGISPTHSREFDFSILEHLPSASQDYPCIVLHLL